MLIKQTIQQFQERQVRTVWDSDQEKWYFSVVDVCDVLTDSKNPTDYLKKIRQREPELARGWGQIVTPLAVATVGGPQKTNFADKDGIFHLIQFINSPKKEKFKSSKANISEHIANIYEQAELVYEATVRNFRTVQKEGNRQVNRVLTFR